MTSKFTVIMTIRMAPRKQGAIYPTLSYIFGQLSHCGAEFQFCTKLRDEGGGALYIFPHFSVRY